MKRHLLPAGGQLGERRLKKDQNICQRFTDETSSAVVPQPRTAPPTTLGVDRDPHEHTSHDN